MPVSALELRPRHAVSIFDAAVRLVTTSTGLWAITLPSGAALTAAAFSFANQVQHHQPVMVPSMVLTLAWLFRALSQGAAAHYAQQQVLGTTSPNAWASWAAAFERAPSLILTAGYMLLASLAVLTLTAGLGFLFFGTFAVSYAVAMQGRGHPLALFSTSVSLLGPARFNGSLVRACGAIAVLLAINLQLALMLSIFVVTQLFGVDLTFANQFVSVTNPVWVTVVVMVTFACFEPIRAACAALLLIDGRVRQEGLDLVAALEQLPLRKKTSIVAAAVLVAVASLSGSEALAAPNALRARIEKVAKECGALNKLDRDALDAIDSLDEKQRNSASRFVTRLERRAYEDEDCEAATSDLKMALQQLKAAAKLQGTPSASPAREEARAILARPEFQNAPEPAPEIEDEKAAKDDSWFSNLWARFWTALERLFKTRPEAAPERDESTGPMSGAGVVVLLVVLLVVAVLGWVIFRLRGELGKQTAAVIASSPLDSTAPLAAMNALSRPALTWASLADELAARGEFREAIRHLYLALLSKWHAEGRITYDPARSNCEYLHELRAEGTIVHAFRELTRRFDFAFYGHRWIDASSYGVFRELSAPLLSEASEASHA